VRLDEKARENLEAAERLLSTLGDTELPLLNASVARAYYAAYQAVVDRALRDGLAFDGTREYFRHDALPGRARDHGILDLDQHDELALLYELRIRADYKEDQVSYEDAADATESAARIVHALVGSSA
jgi:uncharacterized protein (UPF0332 family)